MDSLLSRYRNLSVLLLAISAQLLLLGYQVRNNEDVPMVRVWAVTAVTPFARVMEGARSTISEAMHKYVMLRGAREQNVALETELRELKLHNQYLQSELERADRVQALASFQQTHPSKTLTARVIATAPGANSRAVFVDRGSSEGVMRGMAVVTADGIAGKVLASYPTAAQVMLVTDPGFAAGVLSQTNNVRGTVKGGSGNTLRVHYVPVEQTVNVDEWFYTSGDDRVFPKGLPVGKVSLVQEGGSFKEIHLIPAGIQKGVEEVLIVLDGIHQPIPAGAQPSTDYKILPPPPDDGGPAVSSLSPDTPSTRFNTDADRLRNQYRQLGESQGHRFGEGLPGSRPPDFNAPISARPAPSTPRIAPGPGSATPQSAPAETGPARQ
jgi:rod shape-determining protein MreC